ncbi:tail fiber assembly protein [Stenotrophomonas rhizophila]|uniref:tail fiber assembly protein n=1 Tax=Stenotrophomonas rhizophila TaxID=216778 RepID=UPI001C85E205|nr:tail fiber assembly protein [Stenotrophomonas rhizophila]
MRILDAANRVIPALQDAVDLGDSSANPDLLKAWKQFRVAVNRVVVTQENPSWPVAPQSGYGEAVQVAPQAS